jgi:hypothetical protein
MRLAFAPGQGGDDRIDGPATWLGVGRGFEQDQFMRACGTARRQRLEILGRPISGKS